MDGIKVFKLDGDSLDKILNQVEGHFVDFKRKAVLPSKLTQTISDLRMQKEVNYMLGLPSWMARLRGMALATLKRQMHIFKFSSNYSLWDMDFYTAFWSIPIMVLSD